MTLIFWRTEKSRRVKEKLFRKKTKFGDRLADFWLSRIMGSDPLDVDDQVARVAESIGNDIRLIEFFTKNAIHLEKFKYYRARLGYIQEQMTGWKPRALWDLLTPGYYDRFAWFTAIFGLVFGVIGALSLIASIIQTALAVAALQASWRQEELARQQLNIA